MFDIGFSELVFIGVVALIVLGPERLPKAARFAGLWIRRARAQWYSVRSEFEREMAADDLKRSLQDAKDAVRETEETVRSAGKQARGEFDDIHGAVRDTARDANAALKPPAGPDSGPDPETSADTGTDAGGNASADAGTGTGTGTQDDAGKPGDGDGPRS